MTNEAAPIKTAAPAPTKMKKFLVAFKTLNKSFKIDAQDEKQAELWARQQLLAWKTNAKFVVTAIAITAPKDEKKEKPAEKKAAPTPGLDTKPKA